MFLLKKQSLEELVRKTGFIQNSLEKVLRIIVLLSCYTPRDLHDVYQAAISSFRSDAQRLRLLILFCGLVSRASGQGRRSEAVFTF